MVGGLSWVVPHPGCCPETQEHPSRCPSLSWALSLPPQGLPHLWLPIGCMTVGYGVSLRWPLQPSNWPFLIHSPQSFQRDLSENRVLFDRAHMKNASMVPRWTQEGTCIAEQNKQGPVRLTPVTLSTGSPCGSAGKESSCNVEGLGLIPGLGRSPGDGKAYPLQCFGLENSMDYIVHGVAKSRTRLSDFRFHFSHFQWGFPGSASGKEPAWQCRRYETQVRSMGVEDLLEKGMATHSSILAWRIQWTEEPGRL